MSVSEGSTGSTSKHLDKTWQEIYDAVDDGKDVSVIEVAPGPGGVVGTNINKFEFRGIYDFGSNYADSNLGLRARYVVVLVIDVTEKAFWCSSPNDYPVYIAPDDDGGNDEPRY